ncbi:aminoglycoside phosphotransferase family protein [Microbacterium sp. X-17]|uniref:phosphotransferase family protein n=1 Tax=Microbacterium sp. X-17 TaxID=3144404 RepID=UPI0031F4D365
MDSLTKNRQTSSTIRLMVERAFGAAVVPGDDAAIREFTHGLFSATYRLELADARTVVLKIAPSPATELMTYERNLMTNELEAMALLKAHPRIPVPDVLFADTTRDICGADWFFMSYVAGDNLGELLESGGLTAQAAAPALARLGEMNCQINTIEGDRFGMVAGPGHKSWSAAFSSLLNDGLADAERAGVNLGNIADRVREIARKCEPLLDQVDVPKLVEWDLWPSNAIVKSDGSLCLIDHERAVFGDPLMEAGFIGIDLPMLGDWADFMRGYGVRALTPYERIRRRLYTVYLLVIMVVEPRFRGPQDPAQASWATKRLIEMVELLERN